MLRWIVIGLLFCMSAIAQSNHIFDDSSPKEVTSLSKIATQILANIYSNNGNLDMLQTSDADRKAFLKDQFKAVNITCDIKQVEFINFDSDALAFWGVQCSEKKSFVLAIQNDGTLKIIDCKICIRGKFSPCLNWCLRTTPSSEVNGEIESYYTKPVLTSFPQSLSEVQAENIPLKQIFHDKKLRFSINYPDAWKQWLNSSGTISFGIPEKPWGVLISSLDDDDNIAIDVFKEKPDINALKKDMTQISTNIKFLNEGPLVMKASDNSNLKAYYVIGVYTLDGFWFEILNVMVERKTTPKYLRFVYVSAIAQEKNTLPQAKAMLTTWTIDP